MQNDPVTIWIFKGASAVIPIWVVGSDRLVTGRPHPFDSCLPLLRIRKVENQQVVLRRSTSNGMTPFVSKLQVVGGARRAKHHAVEPVVILE